MKTIKINIDVTGLKMAEEDKGVPGQELFKRIFKHYCLLWAQQWKQGEPVRMTEDDRHLCYKIWDALDNGIKESLDSIDLEDNQMGFMKKVKREVLNIPNELTRKFEDAVDEVKDR